MYYGLLWTVLIGNSSRDLILMFPHRFSISMRHSLRCCKFISLSVKTLYKSHFSIAQAFKIQIEAAFFFIVMKSDIFKI